MLLHFKIRSVLLSTGSSAVTLEPVEWSRKVDPAIDSDMADWEDCLPGDERAEPFEPGGKLTELRFDSQVDWRPGEYISLTAEPTAHDWSPI